MRRTVFALLLALASPLLITPALADEPCASSCGSTSAHLPPLSSALDARQAIGPGEQGLDAGIASGHDPLRPADAKTPFGLIATVGGGAIVLSMLFVLARARMTVVQLQPAEVRWVGAEDTDRALHVPSDVSSAAGVGTSTG